MTDFDGLTQSPAFVQYPSVVSERVSTPGLAAQLLRSLQLE